LREPFEAQARMNQAAAGGDRKSEKSLLATLPKAITQVNVSKELAKKARKYLDDKVRAKVKSREQEVKPELNAKNVFLAMEHKFRATFKHMSRKQMQAHLKAQPADLRPYVLALINEILEKRGEEGITLP